MLLVTLLTLLYLIPKHIQGWSAVMPLLPLAPLFIWGVMHPRAIALWLLAIIGLISDVASALPLGFSALSLCLFFLLVRSQRKYIYREGFSAMWGYFSLFCAALQLADWLVYSWWVRQAAPSESLVIQWMLTVLLYPLLHALFVPLVEKIAQKRYRIAHA